MPAIWDAQFGFVRDGAPLLVGEWGGWLTGRDAVWQRAFAAYLRARHIGSHSHDGRGHLHHHSCG